MKSCSISIWISSPLVHVCKELIKQDLLSNVLRRLTTILNLKEKVFVCTLFTSTQNLAIQALLTLSLTMFLLMFSAAKEAWNLAGWFDV